MPLFQSLLTWLFDLYMYLKYIIIIPFSNYLYPIPKKTSMTSQPVKLPNGTPAFSYISHKTEFISLDLPPLSADDVEFSPIVNVLIKARDGTTLEDCILKEAIVKLGGPQGDFGRKKYTLHDILTWYSVKRDIERIIATNENYEEFIFKNKED